MIPVYLRTALSYLEGFFPYRTKNSFASPDPECCEKPSIRKNDVDYRSALIEDAFQQIEPPSSSWKNQPSLAYTPLSIFNLAGCSGYTSHQNIPPTPREKHPAPANSAKSQSDIFSGYFEEKPPRSSLTPNSDSRRHYVVEKSEKEGIKDLRSLIELAESTPGRENEESWIFVKGNSQDGETPYWFENGTKETPTSTTADRASYSKVSEFLKHKKIAPQELIFFITIPMKLH